ncbi:MAG TPA: DUF2125 domain-containing protein [Vitreimonas sp.]|uniref:DUF2125 domain-containing protein n=1 Tax=Vitreimonas sp. TaxID=3069702 RepID=UPI002D6F4425|nr:DUF2125 domain-containing protein [Vitreimonas sp.]HYD89414.1 DUF2125 domain-containing protein [Vitreimonas sp.]
MTRKYVWLAAPWAVFIVLAIGWLAYWNIVANAAEQRIRAAIADQQARGANVEVERIVRRGFPVMLRFELRNAVYGPARGGWEASTERVDLHLNILNPQHATLEAEAPIVFARAGGAVTNITAEALIATLRMNGRRVAAAGIEADNLALDDPNEDGVLGIGKLVVTVRPDARAEGEYQVSFDAQRLTLPRPVRSFEAFGQYVPMLRAAIVVEQATALMAPSPGDPLAPWREANGRLRFEALALHWGPLQTTGQGWGGLDDQRRLQGSLALPIEEPAPVFTAIANGPNVDDDARRAIGLLATAFALSGDDITLDVDAAGGVLRLEGVGVRTLPAVY